MSFGNHKNQGQDQAFYEILIQQLLQLNYSSFISTQMYNFIPRKYAKINKDDDTQKEKMIIPSFDGAEDVSVGRSNYFSATGH